MVTDGQIFRQFFLNSGVGCPVPSSLSVLVCAIPAQFYRFNWNAKLQNPITSLLNDIKETSLYILDLIKLFLHSFSKLTLLLLSLLPPLLSRLKYPIQWIFHAGANIKCMKILGKLLTSLSILKQNCDRTFENCASMSACWLQFSCQLLCKMERHSHHYVHIWMSSHFDRTNRKTLDERGHFILSDCI